MKQPPGRAAFLLGWVVGKVARERVLPWIGIPLSKAREIQNKARALPTKLGRGRGGVWPGKSAS